MLCEADPTTGCALILKYSVTHQIKSQRAEMGQTLLLHTLTSEQLQPLAFYVTARAPEDSGGRPGHGWHDLRRVSDPNIQT